MIVKLLRYYQRVAHKLHYCDNCHREIHPGDEYRGEVYACRTNVHPTLKISSSEPERPVLPASIRKSVMVVKQHTDGCHDPFEDEMREEIERERRERNKNKGLVAA